MINFFRSLLAPPRQFSPTKALAAACLLLLILFIDSAVRRGIQGIRVSFACEQIELFRSTLEATRSGQVSREDAIDSISNYYPSGTKQATGSTTDRIVEHVRAICLSELRRTN